MDAGVPASTRMAEKIAAEINSAQAQYRGATHALNYAIGALLAHRSARGGNVYDGVDVEQLFAAVQMLGNRNAVEVAPFVSWSPALASIGPERRSKPFFERDFQRALMSTSAGNPIQKALEELIDSKLEIDRSEETFQLLEGEMLSSLRRLLQVDPAGVEYLEPLLPVQGDTAFVATLNYDLSVETVARIHGIDVDTGIGAWRGDYEWSWRPDASLRLLKLHGSIDWTLVTSRGPAGLSLPEIVLDEDKADRRDNSGVPGVVFGSRGKLRAEGPFLAMLRAFEDMLDDADRVVVVGYSFRDDHINTALSRWLNKSEARPLTIVGPKFLEDNSDYQWPPTYPQQLLQSANTFEHGHRVRKVDLNLVDLPAKTGLALAVSDPTYGRFPKG